MHSRARRGRLDLAGVVLVGALIGWTHLAAVRPGSSAGPLTSLVLASALAFLLGRLAASVRRTLTPAGIVGGAAMLAVITPDVLSGTPLGGPLGYANANGAFFVQAAIAALMLAAAARTTAVKLLGFASAAAFAVVPFAAKSVTSAVLLLVLPAFAMSVRFFGTRVAVAGCAALFMAALGTTFVLAASYDARDRSRLVHRFVDASIDERRVVLWHEALVMMGERPGVGVGLSGFQVLSPTARSDPDARWAHNSFLQQGAETGIVGLVLLTLLFLWGFASLVAPGKLDALGVLGAVALAAIGIHACVDYILHFPAVPITAAALVGAARPRE
jgi:O-antigen ligase